ncbi:xanthine dehydrogenase [Clostridium chromiireducens]|uniref:xanthine dehydrogenase n=1 Tax=Clostridium chromiireducens TaxID=225345 RepID=UPI003AF6F213
MKNNVFKMTEKTLYEYKNMNIKIENIELYIESLLNDVSMAGVSYEEKFPTNAFSSSVENEVIKRDEHLMSKIEHLKKTRANIGSLKQRITNALNTLEPEETKLVELRYFTKPKKSWVEIGMTLGLDKDTCGRMKNRIIYKITDLIYLPE